MSRKKDLYDPCHRLHCTVCGEPALYRVVCENYDGYTRDPHRMRDFGCEYICRQCALVNQANRIGEPHRDSDVRYPFTKQDIGKGYTVYLLLNWPYRRARVSAEENHHWSLAECEFREWPRSKSALEASTVPGGRRYRLDQRSVYLPPGWDRSGPFASPDLEVS